MAGTSENTVEQPSHHTIRRILYSGSFAAVLSALGYTAANIFLRSVSDSPAVVVSSLKASWTVILFGPWLIWLGSHGKQIFPSARPFAYILAAAVFVQLCGNWVFQWSLGIIGLATVVPLTMGAMLISGAVLGRVWLGEHVRRSTAISIAIMIAAICLLSWGTTSGHTEPTSGLDNQSEHPAWLIWLATAGACAPGLAYAVLGIAIRRNTQEGIPLATPMVIVGMTGTLLLGSVAVFQVDQQQWAAIQASDWSLMCLAGIANAVAFLALTRALKRIPIVFVNAINASQVAMAALAGLWLFQENLNGAVALGIALTVIGFAILNLSGLERFSPTRTKPTRSQDSSNVVPDSPNRSADSTKKGQPDRSKLA